jgi:hypothetical protein
MAYSWTVKKEATCSSKTSVDFQQTTHSWRCIPEDRTNQFQQLAAVLLLFGMYHHHHHHWLDSPVWALAFFRSFRQSSLSIAAISS